MWIHGMTDGYYQNSRGTEKRGTSGHLWRKDAVTSAGRMPTTDQVGGRKEEALERRDEAACGGGVPGTAPSPRMWRAMGGPELGFPVSLTTSVSAPE